MPASFVRQGRGLGFDATHLSITLTYVQAASKLANRGSNYIPDK